MSSTTPSWATEMKESLRRLHRKVDLIMALDINVLNRVLAGAQALAQQARDAADREKAKDVAIADLQAKLSADDAQIAADAQADEQANQSLTDTATALEGLVQGPETPPAPAVPAPVDAPAVITGDQPVDGGATAADVGQVTDGGAPVDAGSADPSAAPADPAARRAHRNR